jgi:predicted ABC-type transport system involved in lysophospholipase L1 biosynthesis ATPase subunit
LASELLVDVQNLVKRFPAPEGSAAPAPEILSGIDLQVRPSESLAIVGPSGCGKSTLLYCLGALLPACGGKILIDGVDLARLDSDGLAKQRNERLGFVFQSHHLLPQCTALENVLVPTLVHGNGAARREATDRARSLLEQVGLGERLQHRPAQLSGGECQRVAVVRALINQPKLLLADEPTGSLDGAAATQLGELLATLNERQGVALITVTHSVQLAERMGRVLELRDGKLASFVPAP